MNPAPPVPRILMSNAPGPVVVATALAASRADLHPAVITQDKPVGLGHARRRGDVHAAADERGLDPADPADRRARQHDRVLDLAVSQAAVRTDRREWPDIGVGDLAARADDGRADDARAAHVR